MLYVVNLVQPIGLAIRILLAILFGTASLAKLLDPDGTRRGLQGFGIPSAVAQVGGAGLPSRIFDRRWWAGMALAFASLGVFQGSLERPYHCVAALGKDRPGCARV
jgi:hypothetical protein